MSKFNSIAAFLICFLCPPHLDASEFQILIGGEFEGEDVAGIFDEAGMYQGDLLAEARPQPVGQIEQIGVHNNGFYTFAYRSNSRFNESRRLKFDLQGEVIPPTLGVRYRGGPYILESDSLGNTYDAVDGRIYDREGNLLNRRIPLSGSIDADAEQNMFVASPVSFKESTVRKFDISGALLGEFSVPIRVSDVAIDESEELLYLSSQTEPGLTVLDISNNDIVQLPTIIPTLGIAFDLKFDNITGHLFYTNLSFGVRADTSGNIINNYFDVAGANSIAVVHTPQPDILDGDFNDDDIYDCTDIDSLVSDIVAGGTPEIFDLDSNGSVDGGDVQLWLIQAGEVNLGPGRGYIPGDGNLDGVVDASDFNVWNENNFSRTPRWCAGDFTIDGVIDTSDFNVWNSFRFTSSDRTNAVPEPAAAQLALITALGLLIYRRK